MLDCKQHNRNDHDNGDGRPGAANDIFYMKGAAEPRHIQGLDRLRKASVTGVEGSEMGADGQKLPYLDKLVYKIIVDENGRLNALKTGDVDAVYRPPAKDIAAIKKDPANFLIQRTSVGNEAYKRFATVAADPKSTPEQRAVAAGPKEVVIATDGSLRTIHSIRPPSCLAGAASPRASNCCNCSWSATTRRRGGFTPASALSNTASSVMPQNIRANTMTTC